MGIFSFLKKKNAAAGAGADAPSLPDTAAAGPVTRQAADAERERARQREIARATAAKIDAIELEMASAIFDDDAWSGGRRTPGAAAAFANASTTASATASAAASATAAAAAPVSAAEPASRPDGDLDVLDVPELTDILDDTPDAAASLSDASAVEEAAILYADGQLDAAEHVLRTGLHTTGRTDRLPWRMLLDLYQVAGREHDFESVAIDYASRFETSPPAWQVPSGVPAAQDGAASFTGPVPTATLGGRLDDGIGATLDRVLAPSPSPVVRIEFAGMTGATAEGCALLLDALQRLRRAGRELVLAGADGLLAVLRPMLAVGDRDAGQAPWLLALELLLLTDREKAFEETAMDYCITFEVSPPSFERPAHAALSLAAGPAGEGDRFLLPAVVEAGKAAAMASLWTALDAYAAYATHPGPLVLDCSRLARIDYPAAAALAERLRALAADGPAPRRIALRDLNHLVAALLRLLGVDACAQLGTRK